MDFDTQKRNTWLVLGGIGVLITLNIITHGGILNIVRKPLHVIGTSWYATGSHIRFFWIGLTQGQSLLATIEEQESLIGELVQKNIDTYVSQTHTSVREKFDLLEQSLGYRITSVPLSMTTVVDGSRTLIIVQPKENPVRVGQAVISPEGFLIGKVIAADTTLASIRLITNQDSTIAVTTLTNNTIQSIVRGNHGTAMSMELIPQESILKENDLVVSSMLEENIPVRVPIGRIAAVHYTEGELFQTATVAPLTNIQHLTIVGIIQEGL